MIISSYGPSRKKTVSQFWAKINEQKLQMSFNPFAKERRDLNFWRNGVIFRGESDGDVQKIIATSKKAFFKNNFTKIAENEFRDQKIWTKKMF